ncbi:MAG: hypothetical protein IMF09_05605 [Proteobacteria bacterium]|nr:hypothetical protein [Pseudomonadota bacterium]
MLKIRLLILSGLAILVLTACGFQLRGDYQLAERLGKTDLQLVDEYTHFSRKLIRSLERAGVELVTAEAADSIIVVSKSALTREVLSIGNDARVREFRLRLELEFSVLEGGQDESGEDPGIRLRSQLLQQQRDLRFDDGRVLATSREAEFLEEDMSDALVRLFMQRLSQLEPL